MKIIDVKRSYLYEGLDHSSKQSMMLWESAGNAITEAQLTPQQISQLFQQIEQGVSATGSNRTLLGKGKDVASTVNKAYQDLKNKVLNSATMQNFDQAYDQAAEKLKQATGGEQGVMQYVEKYRNFAKKHPVAQSFIYGALIAAAGISGAGAGGAAALGLLKMTDKLLQGEKFSSAAVAGAETGAMAYAAGKVGQAMKGDTTTTSSSSTQTSSGMQSAIPTQDAIPPGILQRFPPGQFEYVRNGDYYEVFDAAGKKMANFTVDSMNEAYQLTNEQVIALLETVVLENDLWNKLKSTVVGSPEQRADFANRIKQGVKNITTRVVGDPEEVKKTGQYFKRAAKAAAKSAALVTKQKAQQIGHELTTKVTADKLQKAWTKAGSPTDSEAIKDLLKSQGVADEVITSAMSGLDIKAVDRSRLPDITKMTKEQLLQLLQILEQPQAKKHTGGKIAGQVSQTPSAVYQRQRRAAMK